MCSGPKRRGRREESVPGPGGGGWARGSGQPAGRGLGLTGERSAGAEPPGPRAAAAGRPREQGATVGGKPGPSVRSGGAGVRGRRRGRGVAGSRRAGARRGPGVAWREGGGAGGTHRRMRLFGRWADRPHSLPSPHPPCPSPGSQWGGGQGLPRARSEGFGAAGSLERVAVCPDRRCSTDARAPSSAGGPEPAWPRERPAMGELGISAASLERFIGFPRLRFPWETQLARAARGALSRGPARLQPGRRAGGLQVCARHSWILPFPFPRTVLRF